jgi:hypothetical protein
MDGVEPERLSTETLVGQFASCGTRRGHETLSPMNAIRIRRQVTSQKLELPELAPFIGRAVEILVIEEVENVGETPQSGVQFALDDGFDLEPLSEAMIETGALSRLA